MKNPIMEAVRAELPFYPGVDIDETDKGGSHRKIVFQKNGTSRLLVLPRTPSDWRAPKNAVRDLRKIMGELGAERVDQPDVAPAIEAKQAKRARRAKRWNAATVSLSDKVFVVHIGTASKLLHRFRTKDHKAAGYWRIELSPSPDLTSPPLIVVRKVEVPPHGRHDGIVKGFGVDGRAWRLTIARTAVPALAKLPNFKGTGVRLYEDKGDELVFQLPAGTIPTGFRKREESPAQVRERDEVPEPVEARAPDNVKPAADAPALVDIGDRPLVLQMPKPSVSVEQAIAVLNRAKRRLGNNLRFQIIEDGYLTAVHRIGH
jgi:hypothetical protein